MLPTDIAIDGCGFGPTVRKASWWWTLRNLPHLMRGWPGVIAAYVVAYLFGVPCLIGTWRMRIYKADIGVWIDYGIVSHRVVTTTGVQWLVDAFQNLTEPESMKYHSIGTDNATAEAAGNTALGAEITAGQYSTGARVAGSLTEGGAANVWRTIATTTVTAALAIVELGLHDSATRGAGTMWDRTIIAVSNLGINDSIQTQYDLTIPAGS
jgi:hypothetical protein